MKKRVLGLIAAAGMIFSLVGCGNKQLFDATRRFDRAIIFSPSGEVLIEGEIDSWMDFEGEQIQIVIDGVTYLTTMNNVVMISE